jgi:hypothetical protein
MSNGTEFHHDDRLDMAGDWTLTYGHTVGLTTDGPAGHFVPLGSTPTSTFKVRFLGPGVPNALGGRQYKGHYLPEPPPHHPHLDVPETEPLVAETFYAGRGVVVVQLIEHVATPGTQYFGVLSGHHQIYATADPTRVEIVGGWCNVGTASPQENTNSSRGNFTLVRISAPSPA